MAGYKTGQKTREHTLRICRKLFYEKGYRETSFGEICQEAEVNPGTISYHFKGKTKIAQTIYAEIMYTYQQRLKELIPDLDDLEFTLLCISVHVKFLYEDYGYRRFISQMGTDCLKEFQEDQYKTLSPAAYRYLQAQLDPEKFDFVVTASVGYDGLISAYISRNIDTLPFEKAVHYISELYLYFMNYEVLKPHIDHVLEMTQNLNVRCKNFDITIHLKCK